MSVFTGNPVCRDVLDRFSPERSPRRPAPMTVRAGMSKVPERRGRVPGPAAFHPPLAGTWNHVARPDRSFPPRHSWVGTHIILVTHRNNFVSPEFRIPRDLQSHRRGFREVSSHPGRSCGRTSRNQNLEKPAFTTIRFRDGVLRPDTEPSGQFHARRGRHVPRPEKARVPGRSAEPGRTGPDGAPDFRPVIGGSPESEAVLFMSRVHDGPCRSRITNGKSG